MIPVSPFIPAILAHHEYLTALLVVGINPALDGFDFNGRSTAAIKSLRLTTPPASLCRRCRKLPSKEAVLIAACFSSSSSAASSASEFGLQLLD
jgi:hypothetical protein